MKKLTPAQQLVAAKKELAKLTKANEVLTNKFKEVYTSSHKISKEALEEAYDPANPDATTKAINEFNKKVTDELQNTLSSINTEVEAYMKDQYKPESVDLETRLVQWAEQSKVPITYEQLMDEVPNKILKKLKEEGIEPESVFKEASDYLKTANATGTYNPVPPHDHTTGNENTGSTSASTEEETENADEIY